MESIINYMKNSLENVYVPTIHSTDILEIIIIAFLVYQIMKWIKNTKAWMLLRGILVLGIFILLAAILRMNTILWLVRNSISVLAIAAVVVFQPELRRALEKLGERNFLNSLFPLTRSQEDLRFNQNTLRGIVKSVEEMAKVKTGALIVVERAIHLTEYENTGIELDCVVSSQVLINIFEHNTPLHDGAIIIRGNRITAATCYLPLSESMELSKELGTRHRAALGLSEVSDALIIVVSEETGGISVAKSGKLERNVTPGKLNEELADLQKTKTEPRRLSVFKRGGRTREK